MADIQPTNQTPLWQFQFEGDWPMAVALIGADRVAAGNRDGEIYIWNLKADSPATDAKEGEKKDDKKDSAPNQPPTRRLEGHTNGISHLLATRDGKLLISASLDGTVRFWDLTAPASGKKNVVLDGLTRERNARRKSEEEQKKILEAPGVEVETQQATTVLTGHRDWIYSLAISRDEKRLISGDATSHVIVWDLASRQPVSSWDGHPWNWSLAAALSPDGQTAVVSEYRYKRDDFDIPAAGLKLWNTADGTEKLDLLKLEIPKLDPAQSSYGSASAWRKLVKGGLIAADFSPDGKLLAVGQGGETDTGQIMLFDAATGKLTKTVSGHKGGICDVLFSSNGKYLLSSGRDTAVRICQVSDGKEVAEIGTSRGGQFKDWLSSISLSPDEQLLAAADIAGFVHVWKLGG